MQELIEIINSVGFPIAMVVYFIYDKNKSSEKMIEAQKESTQILANTLASNTDSIVKNTIILEKLLSKLHIEDI
jgi:hypothetical protein